MHTRHGGHRLAYLASEYAAPSHTFIRREVSALRSEGLAIDTFSIRAAPSSTDGQAIADDPEQTFVVTQQPLRSFALAHVAWILAAPLKYLDALALAARHRPPGLRGLALAAAHFVEAGLLGRQLRRRNIDHLHNHFANSGATVGMIAARLAGVRWSFTVHGVSETDFPAGLLLGRKIEAADLVICASWFMRAQGLRTVRPDQWHKLEVVRCGVRVDNVPLRDTRRTAVRSLICVGRLSAEKAQAGLLEAFARVSASNPELELRLVGDGPDRRLLEMLASEFGIADRVQFLGMMSEECTLKQIAASDLLVLPSFLEGLPVVLMEAMAIGVPVIAPRIAGIPELVLHRKTGLLFTASNWEELAQAISGLISSPKLRSAIAREGRKVVAAQFDVRLAAARLSDLFGAVDVPSRATRQRPRRPSFGLREAILLSAVAFAIAVAVALSNDISPSGSQPLAGSSAASEREIQRNLPNEVQRNSREDL